jgi:hypothetical protein
LLSLLHLLRSPSVLCALCSVLCAGFQPPVITELTTRCCDRRLKSAKARNRGGGWYDGSVADYGDLAVACERKRDVRRSRSNCFVTKRRGRRERMVAGWAVGGRIGARRDVESSVAL